MKCKNNFVLTISTKIKIIDAPSLRISKFKWESYHQKCHLTVVWASIPIKIYKSEKVEKKSNVKN